MLILVKFVGFGGKNEGGGVTPKGKIAKPTHSVFQSYWVSSSIWQSFIQIGEMACITPAWSSRKLALKYMTKCHNKFQLIRGLLKES